MNDVEQSLTVGSNVGFFEECEPEVEVDVIVVGVGEDGDILKAQTRHTCQFRYFLPQRRQ